MYPASWSISLFDKEKICTTGLLKVTAPGLALLLAGCGFHLRGQSGLESGWEALSVRCIDSAIYFCDALESQLRQAGTEVFDIDEAPESVPRLRVLEADRGRRAVTLTSTARAAEYEVSRSITFEVREADSLIIAPTKIEHFQTYTYDAESVLGKDKEELDIRKGLDRLLAAQVANRLALESIKANEQPDSP